MYVYDSIDAPSNFAFRKYVKIRVYLQIRAIYDSVYCICTYMIQYIVWLGAESSEPLLTLFPVWEEQVFWERIFPGSRKRGGKL